MEDPDLVRGLGTFVDNLAAARSDVLHAVFVRSPMAHARLLSVDTAPAADAPGVVAVLAAIAYPNFREQARRGRRADAVAEIGRMQLALERFRAENPTYDDDGATTGTSDFYEFEVSVADATGYTITATPKEGTARADDRCGSVEVTAGGKPDWESDDCD